MIYSGSCQFIRNFLSQHVSHTFMLQKTIRRAKNKGTLVFYFEVIFLFYLKHIRDMEFKSISDLTATCSNICTAPVWHTGDESESAAIPPGPEVVKLFSCSTQLSTKFQLLIKTKIPTDDEVSCFSQILYLSC